MRKSCCLIYNKHASGFKEQNIPAIEQEIRKAGYSPLLLESKYPGYIVDQIPELNTEFDVILTMGGDGTVSEAYSAFHGLQNQHAVYGHIPGGTTNDMGPNTYLPRYDPIRATSMLLNGNIENREIITVNNQPIAYVAAAGILAPATYLIDKSNDKKDIGTFSYIRYGAKAMITDKHLYKDIVENPYQITYTANGQTVETEAIFLAMFNGRSFAHLNINPQANMCDNKFEVAIVRKPSELIKMLGKCIGSENGIMDLDDSCTFSTDHLELTFNDRTPHYPINCDGDPKDILTEENPTLIVESGGKILELVGPKI